MGSSLISSARDAVRATLWPIPTAALVLAVALGVLVPALDHAVDDSLPGWVTNAIFNGDAGAAQTVLDAISSSLITVTSLTFSLTVVTLQLASSQFSPRLLRTFSSDLFVQATLALFLSTFIFSLTLLRLIRSSDSSVDAFVPRLSITLAFLLALASVFMLVLFLAHLTRTIRVESMLASVHDEADSTMRSMLDERDGDGDGDGDAGVGRGAAALPVVPDGAASVLCARSGFVTGVDRAGLLTAAVRAEAVVRIDVQPGSFVVRGVPLARVWSSRGELDDEARDELTDAVAAAVSTGIERTAAQDVAFGLRQLTDVANKALSPGINDPTTAIHAMGHVGALLCDLADRDLGPQVVRDDDEQVRVVVETPDFAELVEVAITQPRRYGASDPQVVAQLLRLLTQLAYRVPVDLRPVVTSHLGRLEATIQAQDFDETEKTMLATLADDVRRAPDRADCDRARTRAADRADRAEGSDRAEGADR